MAHAKKIIVDGKSYKSLAEIARAFDVNERTLHNRVSRSGWSIEEAIGLNSPKPRNKKPISYKGVKYDPLTALAKAYDVSYQLLSLRLTRGYT